MANKQYEAKIVLSSMYGVSLGEPKRANRHFTDEFTDEEIEGLRKVIDDWANERSPKNTDTKGGKES